MSPCSGDTEPAARPPVPNEKALRRIFLGMITTFLVCFAVLVTIALAMPHDTHAAKADGCASQPRR